MTSVLPSPLGRCPRCDASVPRVQSVLAYEPPDGETVIVAECPNCTRVVHPR